MDHPFAALLDIARRSKDSASNMPARSESTGYWRGVGFTLADHRFIAPLAEVSEILQVPKYTRLPGVKSWVQGISNIRGRILPIIDLPAFIGEKPASMSKNKRVLVIAQGDVLSGLVVDSVLGMQYFPADTFSDDIPTSIDAILPFVDGHYQRDDVIWSVISLYNLTSSDEFMQVAV